MSIQAKQELVKEGVNDAYSKPLKVAKGEVYYLVLDNVHENGGGHTLEFFYEQKVHVKGLVKNEEGKALITHVSITDLKGVSIAETSSQGKTGEYEMHTVLRKNCSYSINYYNDSSFVYSKTITLNDSVALKNIRTVLPKLKKGKKYSIGAINFFGGSPDYLPSSIPCLENLYKLLSKNKTLKILMEGHTNGCGPTIQLLSEQRAQTIKEYMLKKGIDKERIQTLGKGCSEMLFPETGTFAQQEQNRRVEIKVLEY